MAIEKELDTIESRPAAADPDIQKLIGRLQSTADRWRERGKRDGRSWAIDRATRDELRSATARTFSLNSLEWPESFKVDDAISTWVKQDTAAAMEAWDRDHPEESQDDEAAAKKAELKRRQSRILAETEIRNTARDTADHGAYARGWFEAVGEVWELVQPSLQM
jgi:hypothetical protein